MSKGEEDFFSAADPVDSLLPVHGRCGNRDAAFSIWAVAEGAAGLFWRIGGG